VNTSSELKKGVLTFWGRGDKASSKSLDPVGGASLYCLSEGKRCFSSEAIGLFLEKFRVSTREDPCSATKKGREREIKRGTKSAVKKDKG